jgi:glycerophosphoryl diester phosphodiesterase
VRKLDPGTAIGSSVEDVGAFYRALAEDRIADFEPRGHALQIPPRGLGADLVTPQVVAAARGLGLRIHVWTINDPAEMRALLDLGVDGLMSDFPARLVEVAG